MTWKYWASFAERGGKVNEEKAGGGTDDRWEDGKGCGSQD